MKKIYLKPEVVSMNVVVEAMIASSSEVIPDEGGPGDFGANKHRGEWGNVWAGGSN